MIKTTKPESDTSSNLIIKKKRNTNLWIAGATVVILLIIGYLNMSYIYSAYYYTFKFKHFGKGDNVYVLQAYIDEKKLDALGVNQWIKPLTQTDWDTMRRSEIQKKVSFKVNTNPNSKTYAPFTGTYFYLDSLRKYSTRRIGTFIKYDWITIKDITGKGFVTVLFCVVKPDPKFISLQQQPYHSLIPSDYLLADSTIYVNPFQISDK